MVDAEIENPIEQDLKNAAANFKENESDMLGEIVNAIKNILSTNNIDQKSRKTANMVRGSVSIRSMNDILYDKFHITDELAGIAANRIEIEVISLKGLGRGELIEMSRNLQSKVEEEHKLLSGKVMTTLK